MNPVKKVKEDHDKLGMRHNISYKGLIKNKTIDRNDGQVKIYVANSI